MDTRYNIRSLDDEKAFEDFIELIRHMPNETVWDMHSCASGLVRYEMETQSSF